jgi:hypothetical protein
LQPLSILFGAGFTVAVGFSIGAVLLKNSCTDPAIRFVTGSAILSALVFATCALGVVFPLTFLLLGTLAIAAAFPEWRKLTSIRPKFGRIGLLFVPFLVLYAANAMAPEISFDGSRYHLGLVSRYLREHGFHPIRENLYAAFPAGVEMLYLFAFAFGRHSAAALTHFAFLLALAWQVFTWARKEGREVAGICAAFLVFASPLIGVDGTSAYNDVAVAAICFTLFHVLDLWADTRSPRLLVAAGLLAGFAVAGKYTAFLAIPYAVVFVLLKSRRAALVVAACSGLIIVPWLVKNWLWFHNPVAPFFNYYFPNQLVTYVFEREYRASQLLPISLSELMIFGPIFVLAPLALRWPRLLIPAAVFSVAYAANTGPRFLIPALPFIALAICFTLARYPRISFAIIALHAILSWPPVLRRYCRADAWRLDKVTYREALRMKPEDGFLRSNLPDYDVARMLDRATPPGSVIFTEVPIPEAYTSREVRVSYQSAGNAETRRVWFTGFVAEHAPVWRLIWRFPSRRSVASVRIVETGKAEWTVHEVLAFDGDRELPRLGWRGPAAVLDGRPVSFWMSDGRSLQIDMPATQLDRLVMQTAKDQPDASFTLDGHRPEFDEISAPSDLRRQAAAELRRRGIDYWLAFDGQFGADDLHDRAAEWGVRQVAEYKGARLYQLP